MAKAVSEYLGIPAHVADDPLTAVARGTGVFLENLDTYASVFSREDES
jgi:rod shape-determining protein MreB